MRTKKLQVCPPRDEDRLGMFRENTVMAPGVAQQEIIKPVERDRVLRVIINVGPEEHRQLVRLQYDLPARLFVEDYRVEPTALHPSLEVAELYVIVTHSLYFTSPRYEVPVPG